MAKEGIDYSWARPGGRNIKNAGKVFVVRYLWPDGEGGKGLDKGELNDLLANGLELCLVYQAGTNTILGGRNVGISQAQTAQSEINRLGLPAKSVVYFAADWDAQPHEQAAIDEFLRGAASVLGAERVGIYGSYDVMDRTMKSGAAKWFWQTYAWSRGRVRQGIHLYQYLNGQNLNGAVDFCRTSLDNYGQISKAGSVAPSPAQPSQPQPAQGTYTVVAGDTLSGIAARYGTTVANLAAINGISNPNLIRVGQVLRLSGSSAPAPSQPAAGGKTYTVVAGDTLSGIAQRFGTTYQAIAAANGIANPNVINVGQVLTIPGAAAVPTKTHTVKAGENLSSIAAKYGTTWQNLQKLNGIANANLIYAGQVLRVS
jgi:LysM repeat protein